MNTDAGSPRQRPPVALLAFYAVAIFIGVASIVQAIRQDSWGPIYTTGWLPAVVVAVSSPAGARACRPRLPRRE